MRQLYLLLMYKYNLSVVDLVGNRTPDLPESFVWTHRESNSELTHAKGTVYRLPMSPRVTKGSQGSALAGSY